VLCHTKITQLPTQMQGLHSTAAFEDIEMAAKEGQMAANAGS
jgi:hypothetical protein